MFGLRSSHNSAESSVSSLARGDAVPAAATDTGIERPFNEDRYAVVECASGLAWIVCDGMGGQAGGELAAQLAIDAIRRDLENLPARPPEQALRSAIAEANRIIVLRRQNQAFAKMGTTIIAAMFAGREVVIGHVGDSRAYLVNSEQMTALTTDHTYVQSLVESGEIASEEALLHPDAHILTRCIGAQPGIEVDVRTYYFWDEEPHGDTLVLCSDGLYSMVSDEEIGTMVCASHPQQVCRELIELANQRGGYDNITLAVIPLPKVLKDHPPEGYKRELPAQQKAKKKSHRAAPSSPVRILGITFLLSAFAALGSMLYVFYLLKG